MTARARRFVLITLALVAFAAAEARAAVVTWQTPVNITAGSDVNLLGTTVFARNIGLAHGNPSAVVNGVNFGFNNPGWTVTFAETASPNFAAYATSAPVMGGPDAANYRSIMNTAREWTTNPNPDNTFTMTFGNLQIGQTYLLQFWVGDWRAFPNDRAETIAANAPNTNLNTPTLKYLDSDLSNGPGASRGQFVIGTWVADATSITFTVAGNQSADYNAVQLRVIPAPAALPAGLALMGLAAVRARRRPRNPQR